MTPTPTDPPDAEAKSAQPVHLSLREATRRAVPALVTAKSLTLLVLLLAAWQHSPALGFPSLDELRAVALSWDGQAYGALATDGYPGGPLHFTDTHSAAHLWAYFPGFPILLRAASFVLVDLALSAVVVNTICELIALAYLVRLVSLERGDGSGSALPVWLLAVYPYAVFLTIAYSESAFLAAATAALFYARSGRHWSAVLAAVLAMTVRITGLALIPALGVEVLLAARGARGWARLRPLLVASPLIPLGVMGILAAVVAGDWLAWVHAEGSPSFGSRHLVAPWSGLWLTARQVTDASVAASTTFVFFLECVFGIAGLAVVIALVASRRVAPSLCAFAAGVWVLPVCLTYWISVPRYEMALVVPAAPLLVDAARRWPGIRWPLVTASAGACAFGCTILAQGGFLA